MNGKREIGDHRFCFRISFRAILPANGRPWVVIPGWHLLIPTNPEREPDYHVERPRLDRRRCPYSASSRATRPGKARPRTAQTQKQPWIPPLRMVPLLQEGVLLNPKADHGPNWCSIANRHRAALQVSYPDSQMLKSSTRKSPNAMICSQIRWVSVTLFMGIKGLTLHVFSQIHD